MSDTLTCFRPAGGPVTPLLPHQEAAVEKVGRLRVGALFMEMGTGKTRTAMELVWRRRHRISRVLWFVPVSLKETIRQELRKHWPEQEAYLFDEATSADTVPKRVRWHIIGIESMSSSLRVISAARTLIDASCMVIVDESSYIKGHRSRRTYHITSIAAPARYRLILTGSPISQGVQDLFAQMRFLSPKILGYRSWHSFAANHLEYHHKYPGKIVRALHTPWIAAKIAPYVYQVTKEECLTLPDKLYTRRYFAMTPEQRRAYEQAKNEMLGEYMEWEGDPSLAAIFRLFTALQQITCGWWRRRYREEGTRRWQHEERVFPHERLQMLKVVLEGDIPPGEKVLIWTKYRRNLDGILQMLGDEAVSFHGRIPDAVRQANLERFRRDTRYLVATPDSGGHGLNLTEAAFVVYYDNGFKYANRMQSEDRCHRLGQTRAVTYIDLHCSGSIDDRIAHSLACKENTVRAFREQVVKMRDKTSIIQAIKAL